MSFSPIVSGITGSSSQNAPTAQQSNIISLDEAIRFLYQHPGLCTETFFMQNFNIVCSLPKAMAIYEPPLNLGSLVRIISNVCKWDCGKQIFKKMVLGLKDKNVALVLCNKPDNLGLNKNLFLLSDSLFNEIGD